MTTEVLAIDPAATLRVLWTHRWTLIVAVAIAAALAYAASFALPTAWESRSVVLLGQIAKVPIENPAVVIRKINVGTLTCGEASGAGSTRIDGVNAQMDAVDPVEIQLLASGRTAEEATRRAAAVADCLVRRHQRIFESENERGAAYLESLEGVVTQSRNNIANIAQLVSRNASSRAGSAEDLLLVTRLGDERARYLELVERVNTVRIQHALDAPTVVVSAPSHSGAPAWPRRGLFAALGGAVALLLASCLVVFAPAMDHSTAR